MSAPPTHAELRARIAERLDPLSSARGEHAATRSDYDRNPRSAASEKPLSAAAVLVGLVDRAGELNLILTRRADTLRRHRGQIALPGGRLEPGEGPVEAALRESWEEIGLKPEQVEPLGLADRYETGTGFHVTPVVGFVASAFQAQPNPDEVAEVFEAPFAFLMNPANHVWEAHDFGGGMRWFYAMTHGERRIWGATAGMLRNLWERLYGDPAKPLIEAGPVDEARKA